MTSPSAHLETHRTGAGPAPALPTTQPKKQSHWVAWLIVIVVVIGIPIAGVLVFVHRERAAAQEKKKSEIVHVVPVVVATAWRGDLPIYLDALGSVTPLNVVSVRTRVDGQIDKIAFTEGQLVHAGDLIAQIDPRPFQVQLEQAEGQLAKDQAALNNAKQDLQRDQEAGNAIAKQQLDTQIATVAQDKAAIKIDQSAIDNAKLQLDYCRVTAPITGVIGLRQVDQGNIVHAADANGIAVITQVQPITVVFSISEDQLPNVLKPGQSELPADAYDRTLTHKLASGVLSAIDNQVDATTGMIKLKARFANDPKTLFPNQFVNVRLLIDTVKNAVLVPAAAVQRGPESVFVYLVKSDQTVEVRNVTLGQTEGDDTVIASGISPGEMVVTDGVDKLQAGSKVQSRKPTTRASTKLSATTEAAR